ncbi:hypothetical protein [Rodentibacter caecimuris]|uniref:hypothetical protein n=1 Tax=Rodentibacter caecimuris TaxID=1796644 RepID=UPI00117A79F4
MTALSTPNEHNSGKVFFHYHLSTSVAISEKIEAITKAQCDLMTLYFAMSINSQGISCNTLICGFI